ncbi:hypothetical protein [Phenylobacterium sp.]|uniref:hypothetical protein n=1 Tax=Phenylobacterium sp. TaxID=1871053 RepID=UPI0025F6FC29|nr:hypothetical protein [Phenylobacterium sp.]MBX3484894.1 hypothetical protein [Phenylobacterium sp.]MCW5760931.1 hypothetical protein [Phenylobacterium sp.]
MDGLDLVDWPADRTLVVSSAPGALRIPLTLRNASAALAQVGEASLAEVRLGGDGRPLQAAPAPVQLSVPAHGLTRGQVRLRLDPATPPGRYEGRLRIGGLSRSVAIEILPEAKLDIRPDPAVVDASSGRAQRLTAAFENRGNTPLTIDLDGAYPLAEEVPTASGRLAAAPETALAGVVDRLLDRAPSPALTPFGVVELAMPAGPQRLEPGAARTVEVSMTLPEGLSPTARYHAFAPVYASDLHIVIVTAAKPRAPGKAARRTKGAAS